MKSTYCARTLSLLLAAYLSLSSTGLALASQSGGKPAAPTQGPAGADWKTYRYVEDNFSADFPAVPQAQPNDGKTGTRYFASLENENFAYFVEKAELPDLNKTPEQLFEDYVNGAAKGTNSQIKSQKPISLKSYPGREFILESDAVIMHFRLYLIGKKLYQVLVVASKSMASRAETDRFLNSFALLK